MQTVWKQQSIRVALSVLLGMASLGSGITQPAAAAECRGTVVLLRGGLGYWPNSDVLAKQFRRHGFRTCNVRPSMYSYAAQRVRRAGRGGPVILVGYSSGGDSACLLARALSRGGVRVQTAVLVEPTIGLVVPANVDYCWNLYESNPSTDHIPIFRGVAVSAESSGTRLENIDVRTHPDYAGLRELTHLNMASSEEVQQLIVNLICSRHGGGCISDGTPSGIRSSGPARPLLACCIRR